jgi:NADPH-dependent ferric siderophore reductase
MVDSHLEAGLHRRPNPAIVIAAQRLTPHMRRLAFQSDAFRSYNVSLPGQWVKFLVPTETGAPGEGRAYTIRSFDQAKGIIEIDFVLHGDCGPVSTWAAAARIGDCAYLGSPRGGHRIDGAAQWRLLAGDETALPAIASILEVLPPSDTPVRVLIEIPSKDDAQPLSGSRNVDVQWLARSCQNTPGSLLAGRVIQFDLPIEPGQVFAAGEGTAIKRLKSDIMRRAQTTKLDAKGYWLLGVSDHRD